ncbi:TPA: nitroreductase family protein [Candidatus Bathyarchaeota archaeon]|nr:nitroreductase family protein [Candidatus Bathyarchaeota archaeon]
MGSVRVTQSKILQIIKKRRSVRKYSHRNVSKSALLKILEGARWAPSAHNAQPWRFIILTEMEDKKRLAEAMAEEWNKDLIKNGVSKNERDLLLEASIECFTQAPIVIVACVSMEEMDKYPDEKRQRFEHLMATQSLAAAIQNMLLVAHSEGLGACWFCAPLFCQDVVKRTLGILEDIEPQALITFGYPDEKPDPPDRKSLEEIVYKGMWGGRL